MNNSRCLKEFEQWVTSVDADADLMSWARLVASRSYVGVQQPIEGNYSLNGRVLVGARRGLG
jgi:hypothetical protein